MATTTTNGTGLGTALTDLLSADDIEPGSEPSYALCKQIYLYHVVGKKLADTPITLAQSQPRDIAVPAAPDRVREKFLEQWKADNCDSHIFNVGSLSRVYGIASLALQEKDVPPDQPIDYAKLADAEIVFKTFDPLNMAGSMVLNLNPNDFDFLKPREVRVAGQVYHRSRTAIKINEKPIYLAYTNASFGFTGRSVYQRALFPLKSFIDTMTADAMVARKAGLLVAKMKPPGSIVDRLQQAAYGVKRAMIQWGRTDNVLGITPDESIETLNMQNVNTAMEVSRRNILDNIATAADMPALLLNQETIAQGLAEGGEDAKNVARYVGGVRNELDPIYDWFDVIIMHRAWSEAFFNTMKAEYPDEYGGMNYAEAFYGWKNAFKATWPNLIEEPESEAVKVADVKLKAMIATYQVLEPTMPDQENKAALAGWIADNINADEVMFTSPLTLNLDAILDYEPPVVAPAEEEPKPAHPFAAQDAQVKGLRAA